MQRKLIFLFLTLLFLPGLALTQDGKIRGKVSDKETGEVLIGATVTIEGTTLGASSDINGEYVLLRVSAGNYSVKAAYVGYAPVTVSNVLVNAAQTTTLDFQLPPSTVQVEPVLIVAERPLVQRNTPNTIRITSRDDVGNLPIRGTQNILALDAGVVQQNGVLYVRGGRSGELAYFVDGASVTNRLLNSEGVTVIQEAFQELQFQPGGYTAEFGGANSGVARTTVRTGTSKFNVGFDYRTDDFAKPGKKFLGTSSFGYRNAVLTFGGPIERLKMRYFFAGQYNYERSPERLVSPFSFDSVGTDINDQSPGRLLPGPIALKENYLSRAYNYSYNGQGTLLFNFDPVSLKLTGSYSTSKSPSGTGWPGNLQSIFNLFRRNINQTNTYFVNLRGTNSINRETFFEVGVSFYKRDFESADPRFGSDWIKYPDSLANTPFGDTQNWTRRYRGPNDYIVGDGFHFVAPGAPSNFYQKNSQRSIEGSIDFVSQITKKWEFKAGGRLEAWLMRQFNINNIATALEAVNGVNGTTPVVFPDDKARRVQWARQGFVDNYGYDVYGNIVDGDVTALDAPKKPIFASAYFQNKIEYNDMVLNLGLRYESFNPRSRALNDPFNYKTNPNDYNAAFDVLNETALGEGASYSYLLPRLNFSFPVTDKTVFYSQYGKYVQMPALSNMYVGLIRLSRTVSPITAGNAFLTPVGFYARPERLTQYEIGFRQAVTDFASLTITGFYKDTKDQLQVRKFTDPQGNALFTSYLNQDFGTIKGLEFVFDLRRTKRLSARINYTLQDARGTGSNPTSSFGVVERGDIGRFPDFINPLDYNQTHRGSIMLDYRFAKGDGGRILEGLGAFVLFTFNSGHAYTKIREPESLGQASPYTIGVRPDLDPRSRLPVEPLNSSSTPAVSNIDLFVSKPFFFSSFTLEVYANVLNLLNSRNIINVYPNTGTAQDDGWLNSALAADFLKSITDARVRQQYVDFYKAFNLQNRWGYGSANGTDLYSAPRQIRFGVRFEY